MQSILKCFGLAGLVGLSFLTGFGLRRPAATKAVQAGRARRPIYYHDPMHPSYKSDKPGIAPDCGMALEPVYGDENTVPAAGTVRLTPAKESLLGLQTTQVMAGSGERSVRTSGVIAADETRLNRIAALADGVVRSVSPLSAGSLVRKDDLLATYFVSSRDLFNAMQAFFLTSGTLDQNATALRNPNILKTAKAESRVEEELLKSYGVTSTQIREMMQTREITRDIQFRAPEPGIVLERSVNAGSVVSKGAELFRIADLSRVWVIADVFEADADAFRPGGLATITYGEYTGRARVTDVRQFDQSSRTLKVRLEMDNPGLRLRPDMPVGVMLTTSHKGGLSVPAASVVDEGRRKVVFVDGGDGQFGPREVTTGEEYGDQVTILSGLRAGERVVTAGTFLLDAESRIERADHEPEPTAAMQTARHDTVASDPVCGMPLSGSSGEFASYQGTRHRFCSKSCKLKFEANPAAYLPASAAKAASTHPGHNS